MDLHERERLFAQQRKERGWDDQETWSLDYTFAKFMLPRLQRFREVIIGHPGSLSSMQEWQDILGKIEYSLKLTIRDLEGDVIPHKEHVAWEEGYKLLGEWFTALWW